MKTMCPFKFNSNTVNIDGDLSQIKNACQCEKHKCELWTDMYTTELIHIYGCALRMIAQKNAEGKIVV